MECKFVIKDQTKNNIKTCIVCGFNHYTFRNPEEIHRKCRADRKSDTATNLSLKINQNHSKKKQEDVAMPSIGKRVFNFIDAIKSFVHNPSLVTKAQYEERLAICNTCPLRKGNFCAKCGCNLTLKAKGAAFHCPEKKWPGDNGV